MPINPIETIGEDKENERLLLRAVIGTVMVLQSERC